MSKYKVHILDTFLVTPSTGAESSVAFFMGSLGLRGFVQKTHGKVRVHDAT